MVYVLKKKSKKMINTNLPWFQFGPRICPSHLQGSASHAHSFPKGTGCTPPWDINSAFPPVRTEVKRYPLSCSYKLQVAQVGHFLGVRHVLSVPHHYNFPCTMGTKQMHPLFQNPSVVHIRSNACCHSSGLWLTTFSLVLCSYINIYYFASHETKSGFD